MEAHHTSNIMKAEYSKNVVTRLLFQTMPYLLLGMVIIRRKELNISESRIGGELLGVKMVSLEFQLLIPLTIFVEYTMILLSLELATGLLKKRTTLKSYDYEIL